MKQEYISNNIDFIEEGAHAPKDPTDKRSEIYVMLDYVIEASSRSQGKPSQEIYLADGRIKHMASFVGGVEDEDILKHLETCDGFHKMVHSIGVSVEAEDDHSGTIDFVLQNRGKNNIYEAGTILRAACPSDGTEAVIRLEDHDWSPDDYVLGKFAFEFEDIGAIAKVTVKFYLNYGYEVPELILEPPVAFGSDEYTDMISKSLLNKGNNQRLKAAIEKAVRGDDVTIAYIGGSITQGAGAKPINTNCYAYKSFLSFKEMFGKGNGENVHYIKAGVGGTPSELGVIRYERDILRGGKVNPDIVIVEFAVNDWDDETKGVCYESLCLKILSAENKPAVVLLFSVFQNDWNLQDRLAPVGYHYDLPMISVKDAVVEQFKLTKKEGNIMSKRQYFYDIYHPTNDGHTVMADCLSYLFAETKKADEDSDDIDLDIEPVIGNSFKDIRLLDRKDNAGDAKIDQGGFSMIDKDLQRVEMDTDIFGTPEFPNNWMHTSTSGNESFMMTIKSSSLILVYKDSGSNEFGKADILVDGTVVKIEDPHIINWTHCHPVVLFQDNVGREHTVEIKMAAGDEDKSFTILGFGYTK